MSLPQVVRAARDVWAAFLAGVGRLDKSLNPMDTINRIRNHRYTPSDSIFLFHATNTAFWVWMMTSPAFPLKLFIPLFHLTILLIPFTSQFFTPALPITSWLICFFSSKFIPNEYRPNISVVVLPTLESVLFGANISDLLTRFTHPILDIFAWLPYGVIHFSFPFFIAAFTYLFRPNEALHFFARVFGYLNFFGVLIQILFPCAAPWYEVIFGLMPANYGMKGSPGGLLRIDHMFHQQGYTMGFSNSPVIFGAFPSLHSACATIEALFVSHFFPQTTPYVWAYAGTLYWATMYLTHHYLIDVVGGSCMAILFFYLMLPDELRGAAAVSGPGPLRTGKYAQYDLEVPTGPEAYELESETEDDPESALPAYRASAPNGGANGNALPKGVRAARQSHKHTASIASLIKAQDRVDEGWSPIGNGSFVFPPTPTRETAGKP